MGRVEIDLSIKWFKSRKGRGIISIKTAVLKYGDVFVLGKYNLAWKQNEMLEDKQSNPCTSI